MTSFQIKALVSVVSAGVAAAAVFFPQFAVPLAAIAAFLVGKELFPQTEPSKPPAA